MGPTHPDTASTTRTGQISVLALDATIEAARAGEAGRASTVVASAVEHLAGRTSKGSGEVTRAVAGRISRGRAITERLAQDLEGTRLTEIASTLVQPIVCNLFERAADVRWWATDRALREALANPGDQALARFTGD